MKGKKDMKIKHLTILALVLASSLTIVNAQEAPALPKTGNTVVVQVTPAAKPVVTSDFEKFPECRLYVANINYSSASISASINRQVTIESLKGVVDQIGTMTSLAAFYDKNPSKFDTKQNAGPNVQYNFIVWEGYIPIKKAGTYTFLATLAGGVRKGFALMVNGKNVYIADSTHESLQGTVNADMKVGMNKLRFCVATDSMDGKVKPLVRYKLLNAIGDFREFTPANLFHKVENEDW